MVVGLETALAAVLPRDVTIRDIRPAAERFNPRYAARYREYRYTIWNGPPSPLRERTAHGERAPLDTGAMARAASAFIGRHDFGAFGAATGTPIRTVTAVRVGRSGRLVTIDVRADSFLRGQGPPDGRPSCSRSVLDNEIRMRSGRHSPTRIDRH